MSTSKLFQQRLTVLVDEYNYEQHTRTELCHIIGVSTSSFSNAVIYGILPTPRILMKIADFFQVSINYLLGKSDTNDFCTPIRNISFHERFTELCQEKRVTHYRVANDCAFNITIITRWFQKDYLPSLEILDLLCNYFKVSPDYLLGRSDFKD